MHVLLVNLILQIQKFRKKLRHEVKIQLELGKKWHTHMKGLYKAYVSAHTHIIMHGYKGHNPWHIVYLFVLSKKWHLLNIITLKMQIYAGWEHFGLKIIYEKSDRAFKNYLTFYFFLDFKDERSFNVVLFKKGDLKAF